MARTWDDKNKDLQIKQRETAAYQAGKEAGVNEVMMIGKAHPPGQPGPPNPDPSSPYEKGKSPHKLAAANNIRGFQDSGYQLNIPLSDWKDIPSGIRNDPDFIKLHLRRMKAMGLFFPTRVPKNDPNAGKPPFDDEGNDLSVPVRGHEGEWANKGMTIAHTPHTPESTYDDYGRPEKVPRYRSIRPSGELFEIPWLKKLYQEKHPQLEQLHNEKYHKDLKISQSRKDKVIQNTVDRYGKKGGMYQDQDKLLRNLLTIAESTRA